MSAQRVEHLAEGVTLYLGDCREILPTIERADSIITDPPYGISLVPLRGITKPIAGDGRAEAKELWEFVAAESLRIAAPDSAHMFWTGWSEVWTKDSLAAHLAVNTCVVWAKNMWGIGYYTRPQHEMAWYCHKGKPPVPQTADSNLWQMPKVQNPIHSCEKPVELLKRCINLCEHSGSGTVLDPFMGVGSTGVAAVKLGRRFVGCEIDPKYFDIACRRISEALKSPDLFIPTPKPKATQEPLL